LFAVLQRKDYYSVLYEYYVGQLGHIVLFYFLQLLWNNHFGFMLLTVATI